MTEGVFVQRLVGKFKNRMDVIHERGIGLQRSIGRASKSYHSRETSGKIYSLPADSGRCASSHASIDGILDGISRPKNHSRQRNRARTSSELRGITREAPLLPDLQFTTYQGLKVMESDFTGSYELDDQTEREIWGTSSPTQSSDEPFSSPSTTNACQGWETETLCPSCHSRLYFSNSYHSPKNYLNPIIDPERRKPADLEYFPSSMDEPRKLNRSKSLWDQAKPKLRRVTRVNNLFLAANGVSKSS